MDPRCGLALPGLALLILGACSSTPSHPAALGDCHPIGDAACAASSSGGGSSGSSSGSGEGGAPDTGPDDAGPVDAEAGLTCAADGSAILPSFNGPCVACIQASCCAADTACAADAACVAILQCPAGGLLTCETQNPGGVLSYNDLASCLSIQCSASCPQLPVTTVDP